ncbi:MAG: hypothetical protein DRI71_12105 [Bacteroidetes bacterium]|nr:MAG: hypothetical protein DRI71_12105 [Bacteroidota bacterium]
MKLPSIIIIPAYQRFKYEPRFYDPIKEDIDGRRKRVKRHIEGEKKRGTYSSNSRIEGAFARRVPHEGKSSFLRLIIAAILFGGSVGFLYFGNIAIYITVAVVLGYVLSKKFITK